MSESDLQTAVLQALERIPDIHVMRLNSGFVTKGGAVFRGCPAGTSDVIVVLPNMRCIWIELKPEKPHRNQKTIAKQREFREKMARMKHIVLELRNVQHVVDIVMHHRAKALGDETRA